MHVYVCLCMRVGMYASVYIHAGMHVYVCMRVCMCVCLTVYAYAFLILHWNEMDIF